MAEEPEAPVSNQGTTPVAQTTTPAVTDSTPQAPAIVETTTLPSGAVADTLASFEFVESINQKAAKSSNIEKRGQD